MQNITSQIAAARTQCHNGAYLTALELLRGVAQPDSVWAIQSQYARISKEICRHQLELPSIRVAFLAGSTVDHFVDCLRFWLLLEGFRLESYIVPFDTWRQEALDRTSNLYSFGADVVWFFLTARDVRLNTGTLNPQGDPLTLVDTKVLEITDVVRFVTSNLAAAVILNNAEATSIRVLGNLEAALAYSSATITRYYNLHLSRSLPEGVTLFDLDYYSSCFGLNRWEDFRLWCHSKHPFSLEANGPIAFAGAKVLSAFRGRSRKCVVLDLDNTLWGGIAGDDGAEGVRFGSDAGAIGEAFANFQSYLKLLSQRGIALAVCSKNDPELARQVFLRRPDMILGLEDFAVFCANWENKADNLRNIAAEMNLGLDAMVFVDDNPAERALVRAEIPEIAVPEMPDDPTGYVRKLASGTWFETLALSEEDRNRSRAYRENAARKLAQTQTADIETYLKNLEMHATWGAADSERLARISQLINKTNQFHLTTTRYSQSELTVFTNNDACWVGWFTLSDCFGDHGVIAAVILRFSGDAALIDTWTMSCRVFSRTMEEFIFIKLWEIARSRGCRWLEGVYFPTIKNGVVSGLYQRLGGTLIAESETALKWRFELTVNPPSVNSFIKDMSRVKVN